MPGVSWIVPSGKTLSWDCQAGKTYYIRLHGDATSATVQISAPAANVPAAASANEGLQVQAPLPEPDSQTAPVAQPKQESALALLGIAAASEQSVDDAQVDTTYYLNVQADEATQSLEAVVLADATTNQSVPASQHPSLSDAAIGDLGEEELTPEPGDMALLADGLGPLA